MNMRYRHASTLLELIIATALFSTLLVLVIEAMMNLRGLAHTIEDIDILEEEAGTIRKELERDFSNSGWFYCLPGANGQKFYPQIHLSTKETWQLTAITPPPTVTIKLYNPSTMAFADQDFTASVTENRASVLGDAIVFARLQSEGQPLSETPTSTRAAIVNFRSVNPLPMDKFASARPVQSLLFNPNINDQDQLSSVVWETTPSRVSAGLLAGDLFDDENIRLFCYRVVPDPQTGRGQLIRYYSNPGSDRNDDAAWIVDKVIANDVVGMRIYSSEMASWYGGTESERDFSINPAAGLTSNQVRFSIELARNFSQINGSEVPNQSRARSVRTLQFTVGMRSITNAIDQ